MALSRHFGWSEEADHRVPSRISARRFSPRPHPEPGTVAATSTGIEGDILNCRRRLGRLDNIMPDREGHSVILSRRLQRLRLRGLARDWTMGAECPQWGFGHGVTLEITLRAVVS